MGFAHAPLAWIRACILPASRQEQVRNAWCPALGSQRPWIQYNNPTSCLGNTRAGGTVAGICCMQPETELIAGTGAGTAGSQLQRYVPTASTAEQARATALSHA